MYGTVGAHNAVTILYGTVGDHGDVGFLHGTVRRVVVNRAAGCLVAYGAVTGVVNGPVGEMVPSLSSCTEP